jgi:hypothetical protein
MPNNEDSKKLIRIVGLTKLIKDKCGPVDLESWCTFKSRESNMPKCYLFIII